MYKENNQFTENSINTMEQQKMLIQEIIKQKELMNQNNKENKL